MQYIRTSSLGDVYHIRKNSSAETQQGSPKVEHDSALYIQDTSRLRKQAVSWWNVGAITIHDEQTLARCMESQPKIQIVADIRMV